MFPGFRRRRNTALPETLFLSGNGWRIPGQEEKMDGLFDQISAILVKYSIMDG